MPEHNPPVSTPPETRLRELGLELPTPPSPVAAYIPAKRVGNLLYVSGQIPMRGGAAMATGRVPDEVSPETARECARQCALNGLAVARAAAGSLDNIAGVVRVGCFVASAPGFGGQPAIANGASELMVEVFGEHGRHARAAVGSVNLPLNVPVEVEFLFELNAP
jgi:enamine deaminase RidA (YjgF/YER057c/UK114 family)